MKKPQPEAFRHVLKDLGIKASEAVIFDNTQSNIDGAEKLGIKGFVFKGAKDAETQLKRLGLEF